jgi:hypothetical protein
VITLRLGVCTDVVTELTSTLLGVYVGNFHAQDGIGSRLYHHQLQAKTGIVELESRANASRERRSQRIAAGEIKAESSKEAYVPAYYKYACVEGRTMNHRIL